MAERIEPVPFGDMEQWTVRYIKESKLLGGQTKVLYSRKWSLYVRAEW